MPTRKGKGRQPRDMKITVDNPAGVSRGVLFAEMDGVEIVERPLRVRIVDDGAVHRVRVGLWLRPAAAAPEGEAPSSPVNVSGPFPDRIGPLVDPARAPFGRRLRQIAGHVDMGDFGPRMEFLFRES